jgi:hypothetical protein
MEWKVKIEDQPDRKITVEYLPLQNSVIFRGRYKIKNSEWIVVAEETKEMHDGLDLNVITDTLGSVSILMDKNIRNFENLNEGFKYITMIEIEKE